MKQGLRVKIALVYDEKNQFSGALPQKMRIVADINIPFVKRLFGEMGSLTLLEGRAIRPEDVQDADVLIVRSVTKVDKALLKNSSVRFVGSTTTGTDHLDLEWLAKKDIQVVHAPGCNANSVVDYVVSAIDVLSEQHRWELPKKTLGIIGFGNIGTRLHRCASPFVKNIRVYDPFIEPDHFPEIEFTSLNQVLRCDIVSIHVPLTTKGEHPTVELFSESNLARLPDGACLINTSRGRVLPESILKNLIKARPDVKVVLDVWESEPKLPKWMLKEVDLLTPHIAGYAYDGKIDAVETIFQAFCRSFGVPKRVKLSQITPRPWLTGVSLTDVTAELGQSVLSTLVRMIYDIRRDDMNFRLELEKQGLSGVALDHCRRHYPERRSFSQFRLACRRCSPEFIRKVQALGFKIRKDK